jgi:peptidoglycan-N-acetylglucosamine deacetylase
VHNPISLYCWKPVITRQPARIADVALTFDDGPTPETTLRVLSLLNKAGAKATFFLSGVRVAANPELVGQIVEGGHAIYGHAWEHENLALASPARAVNAMRRIEDALARFLDAPSNGPVPS